ncbi:MAG: hypothetical protein PVG32_20280 [Anaerolineales bacterium]|jgi:hypothetical protein
METESERLICHLLQAMLEVALLDKPYPGQKTLSSFFPDIEMVKDLSEIVVSSRNLGDSCHFDVPGYNITVLSDDEIAARARSTKDFPYFMLTEARISPDNATLSLQLSWAVGQADKLHLGGGGVRVKFERINGEWQAPSGPIATWIA